ncbi:hypothetical protein [Sharpea azabuensis]|uniref:hypothetical protein n=1 Tax=Sharpea azabuensis TaxID=322505 RepID=UPI002E81D8BC|nr:hypothetical protein [Sharpea azabuensis]MEE3309461.1 hypothetical protein [Sharpea azabuensis]
MLNDMTWTMIIGILLAVFGFASFLSMIFTLAKRKRCNFKRVGVVVELKPEKVYVNAVDESKTGEYTEYSPVYEVEINKTSYRYDNIGLFEEDDAPKIGSKLTFHINPDNFSEYYLDGESYRFNFGIVGIMFMFVGIGMAVLAYFQI